MSKRRLIYLSGGMSGVERADYVRRFGEAKEANLKIDIEEPDTNTAE